MFLDERKKNILRAIIDDYIDTAEPIGSRTIARKHELGLSSATIRNEMADLEEMGYLEQPHTSAGRIPSDKGYRVYVDNLLQIKELPQEEIESIKNSLDIKINEMSQLIRQASIIISRLTRYTSVAITPQVRNSTIKAVQVVPVEPGKALVIVVNSTGIVRNELVKIDSNVSPDALIKISNIINDSLSGFGLHDINPETIQLIENKIGEYSVILPSIIQGVEECISQVDSPEVYTEGTTNIFNYPEFRDIIKAKGFLDILDEKSMVCKILCNSITSNSEINFQIGAENQLEGIKDCSLVTTTYSVGDVVIGSIGIIGPTRMDYGRVISSLNYIKSRVTGEIIKLIGENLDGSG